MNGDSQWTVKSHFCRNIFFRNVNMFPLPAAATGALLVVLLLAGSIDATSSLDPDRYKRSTAFFFSCIKDEDIDSGFSFYPTSQAQGKTSIRPQAVSPLKGGCLHRHG